MKNIHILPTDKPSRVVKIYNDVNRETFTLKLDVEVNDSFKEYVNIYIISEEKIKDDNYFIDLRNNEEELYWEDIYCAGNGGSAEFANTIGKKIILTTDQELIKDGVQPIDDEFLEWFVENPSCEFVKVDLLKRGIYDEYKYKIIIPKEESKIKCYCGHTTYCDCEPLEEHKQETLEEAAERLYPTTINSFTDSGFDTSETERLIFKNGAKWQQERMYSEEEVYTLLNDALWDLSKMGYNQKKLDEWFEQFKKK